MQNTYFVKGDNPLIYLWTKATHDPILFLQFLKCFTAHTVQKSSYWDTEIWPNTIFSDFRVSIFIFLHHMFHKALHRPNQNMDHAELLSLIFASYSSGQWRFPLILFFFLGRTGLMCILLGMMTQVLLLWQPIWQSSW